MNKIRMQRILSLLLVVIMIFSNGSLTALASGGAHIDSGSNGVDRLVGGSGGSSNYTCMTA